MAAAPSLKLVETLLANDFSFDLLEPKGLVPAGFASSCFGAVEVAGGSHWCWTLGPRATLSGHFVAGRPLRLSVRVRRKNPLSMVRMLWCGRPLALERNGDLFSLDTELTGTKGDWEFAIEVTGWNGATERWEPQDDRPLACLVERLRLEPAIRTAGRICPYPFSRMEMPGEPFVPCCSSWLKEEFFSLPAGDDPWNGPAAQALRASVFDGSYRYCHLDRCRTTLVEKNQLAAFAAAPGDLPLTTANLLAVQREQTVMPEGPTAATLMGDPRCNLACASCRPGKVTRLDESSQKRRDRMQALLQRYGAGLRILKTAGDGEVFFSPDLRAVVAGSDQFPALERLDILTNGLLFDEAALAELRPGSDRISRVSVSLDAGNESAYHSVRGGDWQRLGRNLRWMAAERKSGRFEKLDLSFVLRAGNVASLPEFLGLAAELGVDEVYVSQLLPWERMRVSYETEAVHRPEHPGHASFQADWAELRRRPWPFVLRSNLA